MGLSFFPEKDELKQENTLLRGINVFLGLGAIALFMLMSNQYNSSEVKFEKQKIVTDSLQHMCDSLHDRLFETQTTLGRYELTLDYMKTEYPKAGNQFENFMYTQTE